MRWIAIVAYFVEVLSVRNGICHDHSRSGV